MKPNREDICSDCSDKAPHELSTSACYFNSKPRRLPLKTLKPFQSLKCILLITQITIATMAIKVHGMALSTCTARVLLCLCEKGVDYELVPVDVYGGAHKQQPYLSLNPFGQIPAFEDEDLRLFESRAICKYVARKYWHIGTDLLRLGCLKESAVVETWIEVESNQFHGPIRTLIHQLVLNPRVGKGPDEKIVEDELQNLGKVLDVYEERLSKSKYLAGDYYTMADMLNIPYLVYFMRTPKATLVTSRPHVNAWWNDISSRPATIKVSEGMNFGR